MGVFSLTDGIILALVFFSLPALVDLVKLGVSGLLIILPSSLDISFVSKSFHLASEVLLPSCVCLLPPLLLKPLELAGLHDDLLLKPFIKILFLLPLLALLFDLFL